MIIGNTNNINVFMPNLQMQNAKLKNLIEDINTKAQQKNQRFDIVEISAKVRELQNSENDNTNKIINHENSPLNGSRTEAEWAESSLTQQRNGVNSIKNVLGYQKERLNNILSEIDSLKKISIGDFSESNNSVMSPEGADELINKYKNSIKTDFSKVIEDTISFYNSWVKTYDKYSGGLASKVMGNVLQDISAQSLGLDNLSDDPTKIMEALDNAIEKLDDISKSIEDTFNKASGKTMTESTPPNTDMWKTRIELENMFTKKITADKNILFTGQTLKINDYLNFV